MEKSIIITAGGIGKRMASSIPKQFMNLNGRPILMYTIECFYHYDREVEIILVLPENQIDYWKKLCTDFNFEIKHQIVLGGSERFHSVKNGLAKANGALIAVHDAVRPLVSNEVIESCFDMAGVHGAAIPVIEVVESIRKIEGEESTNVNRSDYKLVQTPQIFQKDILLQAYNQPFVTRFTDDASVVEANGQRIHLISGNEENIKITRPFDLQIASLYLIKHG